MPLLGYDTHGYLLHPLPASAAHIHPHSPRRKRADHEVVGFTDAHLLSKRWPNRLLGCRKVGSILGKGSPRDWLIVSDERHVQREEVGCDVDQAQSVRHASL